MPNGKQEPITRTITPAQDELLKTCSHLNVGELFHYLQTTMLTSISYFASSEHATPSESTLDAWYFTLDFLGKLHNIEVEDVNNSSLT